MVRARIVRPLLAAAGLLAVVTAVALPAGAQTPPTITYKATAKATGLDLQAFGQGITLGLSQTGVSSDPKADAAGVGLVLPGAGSQNAINASSGGDGQSTGTPAPGTCGPLTLPDTVPVVDLKTACSSAVASIQGGLPSALSTASVADAAVNATDVVSKLPLGQILGQDQLDQLNAVLKNLDATGVNADDIVSKLLDALKAGDLVKLSLGPTQAESKAVDADTQNVMGVATAQGAVIDLLPRDALNLPPVAKIEVGAATNAITVNRNTGDATVKFDPSLVRVTLADDIVTALGPAGAPFASPVSIAPGQSQCIPLPDPLVSCITVAGGSQSKLDDGTTHAEAAGVSLQLLKGVQGGVNLSLANTVVEGLAVGVSAAPPPPPPGQDLARTGGSTDAALVGGLLALAVAGYLLTRSGRRSRELEPLDR